MAFDLFKTYRYCLFIMLDLMHIKRQRLPDTSSMAIKGVFAVMLSCVVFLGGYSFYQIHELRQRTEDIYFHSLIVSNALRDISINIISMRSNMQDIPFAKKRVIDAIVAEMQTKETKALASFDVVLSAFPGDKKEIEKTRNMFMQWHKIRETIISVAMRGEREKAYAETHGFGLVHVTELRARIRSHIAFANSKAHEFRKASARLEKQTILMSAFLLTLIFGITIISFVFISRRQRKYHQEIQLYIDDIEHSEHKFRDILDAVSDNLLVVDSSGKIIISNLAAQKIFGYTQEDLVGSQIDMLIPTDMRHGHQSLITNYFKHSATRPMSEGRRLKALHKDGHLFPVTINLIPVTLEGITYTTCNVRDMTSYEQLEENFRQAQKMKSIGTLVGGIAHDFNNILAAITGATFLARQKLGSDNKHLSIIESQSLRAADIVKQLLAFARKDIKHMEVIDLSAVVKESSRLFKLTTAENIQFNIDICKDRLPIKGDITQLQQVIINLVNNARDALAHSATPVISIVLRACDPPDECKETNNQFTHRCALITVADNGHGIDKKHIKEIFDPFFTKKEVGKGTGLGLAMVKGTIESHAGVINVESEVGEGTTFNIFLPLLPDVDVIADIDVGTEMISTASGECILLVDDESALREVNREILEALGYRVEEAGDGLQAVEKYKASKDMIRLIIMDVVMPRMGGIKAAEKIRQISATVPIIFATGYDQSQVLGEDEGSFSNSAIITKPFPINQLHEEMSTLLHS